MYRILFFLSVIFLSLFIPYFPSWFDSGEFATALFSLGVSHPSGHPTYLTLGHLFTLIPLGSVAYRASLISVFGMALGLTVTAWTIFFLNSLVTPTLKKKHLAGIAGVATILLMLHPSFALQAWRVEVYALQFFAGLLFLALTLQGMVRSDLRYFLAAWFLLGLAMGLNPLLTAVLGPALFLAWYLTDRRFLRVLGYALPPFLLGLGAYLFLPLRSLTNPVINWDAPVTWQRFWGAFTARDFHVWFHSPLSAQAQSDWLSFDIFHLLPIPLGLFAVWGGVTIWRKGFRAIAAFLASAMLLALLAWLLKDFHLQNPDSHAYVLLPIVLGTILGSVGASALGAYLSISSRRISVATSLILLLCFFRLLPHTFDLFRLDISQGAEMLSQHLDHAPPRAAISVASDHWLFPFWYRSYVEGRRPDVAIIGEGLLPAEWYRKQTEARYGSSRRPILWRESKHLAGQALHGYLFSDQASMATLQTRFNEACRNMATADPYQIQTSICARVILMAASIDGLSAIRLEETYLGHPPAELKCHQPKDVVLPYPLSRDLYTSFLPKPEKVVSDLGFRYLRCGRPDLASKLLEGETGDVDSLLLRAYLLATPENIGPAIDLLKETSAHGRKEIGLLALARATLYYLDGDTLHAKEALRQAAARLGKNQKSIKALADYVH